MSANPAADSLVVEPGGPLRGTLRVPGDKSISHRAILLAAKADGTSVVRGLSDGDDVQRSLRAVQAMGARVDGQAPEPDRSVAALRITGGPAVLHEPAGPLDVGNSGTAIRLLAGFVAAYPWFTVLYGDASIASRPMERVAEPLRRMGAKVDGRGEGRWPPLAIRGGRLTGIELRMPVASAQVKSAVLLAGLGATSPTTVHEPAPTRAHTEEMLAACGADITVTNGGSTVRVAASPLRPFDLEVPGDPSQAAFWIVAACTVPDSDVTIEGVYVGRARATFLDVLARMGADVTVVSRGDNIADVRARFSTLVGTVVAGAEIAGLIDEIPALAVAGATASGVTEFRDAGELRVKESDRIATLVQGLGALGASVDSVGDGLRIRGGTPLRGATVDAHGDHRIAMALAVTALRADGRTRVEGWSAVATSYPSFVRHLEDLRA